ncbi:MAG TPA: hypothetical protein VGX78_15300 [Pirellulales bacterium]|nr:hypothetical protein [Pirellulales bacterium]
MADLQIFELIEPLESGGRARGHLLFWNGSTYIPIPNGRPVVLHDFVGSHGMIGDRGYCSGRGIPTAGK